MPPVELGRPLDPPCQLTRLRFRPDGRVLAGAGCDGKVHRWATSADTPTVLPPLDGHNGWVSGLAFGPAALFTADSWGRLTARDNDGKQLWTVEAAHDGWARSVAVSADGTLLASGGRDGHVRFWDTRTGAKRAEVNAASDILGVTFTPDGATVLAGDLFGVVREFEAPTGRPGRTFEARELHKLDRVQDVGGVRSLLLSPDGRTLVVGGAEPKSGGFVECTPLLIAFDRPGGKRLWQWKGGAPAEGYVTDLAWHPGGSVVACTSGQPGQGKVLILKPGEAQPVFQVAKPNVQSVALTADGSKLAAALTNANSSGNGRVRGQAGDYPENRSPVQLWRVPPAA
ncbi:WD40 repeat domain-containing protein [Urbifossiella limnaea]|uniref:WD domain, G-beta repeat n=1 Tax=Urbifossiella limnaea TaxID=2528023 RepID=A0A517XRM3_9BACT|nr:PQQ-binding-like beta-propeller repeat protein [Urbifossiella limnaea]QDU20112.1 WD domain, G-beta repeat [Urbifossiella limnaea]